MPFRGIFNLRRSHRLSVRLGLSRCAVIGVASAQDRAGGVVSDCLSFEEGASDISAVSAVETCLRQILRQKQGREHVGLVLSSHYCRYLSLPWSDVLLENVAGVEYLRQAFVGVYGEVAADWEIVFPNTPYGQTFVACAIARELLNPLRGVVEGGRWAYVRPWFSVAYEVFRQEIRTANAVFALVEEGLLTVGRLCERGVVEVEVLPVNGAWEAALAAWLSRTALSERDLGPVLVLCPPVWQGDVPRGIGAAWRFLEWPELARGWMAENPAFALVACVP